MALLLPPERRAAAWACQCQHPPAARRGHPGSPRGRIRQHRELRWQQQAGNQGSLQQARCAARGDLTGSGVGEGSPRAPEGARSKVCALPVLQRSERRRIISLCPGDATSLWRCPKALPSQRQPWVERGCWEGLRHPGRWGRGMGRAASPQPSSARRGPQLLPASREQGSNSIWIWRPLAGAKAVGRQPGTGSVRVTLVPPSAPGASPDPVALQTSMKTLICNRLGSQGPSGCSAEQGWPRHGASLPSSFPKKKERGDEEQGFHGALLGPDFELE